MTTESAYPMSRKMIAETSSSRGRRRAWGKESFSTTPVYPRANTKNSATVAILHRFVIHGPELDASAVSPLKRFQISALWPAYGRSILPCAAPLLMLYLALVPPLLKTREEQFQLTSAFYRDPESHWAKVKAAIQQVRSDAVIMSKLNAAVSAELAAQTGAKE